MANSVQLKIGADTSELEKAFSTLLKKIQGEADKLKLSPSAQRAAPGVSAVQEAAQTSRSINQKIREEKAGLDIINRELARKKALIDEIAKRQADSLKGSREELALAERINREKEKLQRAEKLAQVQKENFRKAQEAADRAMGIQKQGAPSFPGGTGLPGDTGKSGFGSVIGGFTPAAIIGGLTGAIVRGINEISNTPSRSLVAGGSAVSQFVGKEYASIYNGTLPNELAFTKEKTEAKEMADKQERANRLQDNVRTAAAIALGTKAAVMVAEGFAPGAVVAGGLGLGAAFGGSRMFAKTAADISEMIPGMGGFAKQERSYYNNLLAQQNAEDYSNNLAAKKQLNPTKVLAVDEYNQNSQRDLDFQRQTGLTNDGFRGRFKTTAFDAGFTGEQAMTSASSILGSGGSTRAAVGNATTSLQAQRNLDVTNAGSIIGKLSSGLGSADTTKEAFVKLLAEGTRVGLDGSDFREENRRFVESAADMITKSGATTGEGVDQVLSQFGRFFGDKTNAGIDAGKSAFNLYRETSMATTGPRGTMRAAGMLTDPTINKLSRDSREALFNMPIDQLTPDNPAIIAMAQQAKTTPQALIDAQNRITSNSANLFKNSDTARDKLANVKKKYGIQSAIGYQGPFSPQAYTEIKAALGESNIAQIKEHPELGQDQRLTSAYSDALSSRDSRGMNKALEEAKARQLGSNTTTRVEDDTNKVRAEMSREVNRIFTEMKDSIVPASDAAAQFVQKIKELNAEMMKLPDENQRADFANKNILTLFGHAPTTAPSAGSPSSGGGNGS
ncbi:unnamed protein product [Sphagnum balticum]